MAPPPRPQPGSLEALREGNRQRVIAALRESGTASRADLARLTGLSRTTVSTVVGDLMEAGLLREVEPPPDSTRGAGRPPVPLALDPSAGAALGIDIAHDAITASVGDLGHRILATVTRHDEVDALQADAVIDMILGAVDEALAAAGVPQRRLIGAAVAVPSPIDPTTGRLGSESVVPSLAHTDLGEVLGERLGTPVLAENDANLCVVAEQLWGAARGHETAVYVKLSKGIGAGLLIGGRLHRGAHGSAGEIGHQMVMQDGPLCRCGNRGCLEVVAGSEAIREQVAGRFAELPTIPQIVERAIEGDALCRRALRDVGALLGTGLAGVCNLINPSVIVIGGDLTVAWRLMEVPLREALDRAAIHSAAVDVTILPSPLGPRPEARGAIGAVLRLGPEISVAAAG